MKSLWAITLAVPHEIASFFPDLRVHSEASFHGARYWEASLGWQELVLVQTGIGPERAGRAAAFLLDHYPVTHLISSGYCGALQESFSPGHAVLATHLAETGTAAQGLIPSDPALVEKAHAALDFLRIPFRKGILLTSPRPVLKVPEKESLGVQTGAVGVDMESYSIIKVGQNSPKKIASVTVRFIVDALQDELTDTEAFLDDQARVQPLKLAREILRRPKILVELPGLEKKASQARANMGNFFRQFFGVEDKPKFRS